MNTPLEPGNVLDLNQLRRSCASCALHELCLPAGIDGDDLKRLDATIRDKRTLDRGEGNEPYVALDHEPVTVAGGQTAVLDRLPVGAECWATEPDLNGAAAVTISATEATPVVVGSAAAETVTITVDNRFDAVPAVTGVDGEALGRIGLGALLLVLVGGAAVAFTAIRRRRA